MCVVIFVNAPTIISMQLNASPLAHSRVEHLDVNSQPVVSIFVNERGEFGSWRAYRDDRAMGIGRQRSAARSIGLFVDFLAAKGNEHQPLDQRSRLLRNFAAALVRGTIEDGDDPSMLFWLPRTRREAKRILNDVTAFGDWLVVEHGARPLNPTRQATLAEEIAFWRSWNRSSRASLLSHLNVLSRSVSAAKAARAVTIRGSAPVVQTAATKAFPEDLFRDLLTKGFARSRPSRWSSLRDRAIALLLHEGGLRVSEVLHLWVDDVCVDPQDPEAAVVRVYHPSEGSREYKDPATGIRKLITRAEYLRLVYDRVPLTELPGRKSVGWKDPLLNDATHKFIHVFWRSQDAARAFMKLYMMLVQERPRPRNHPYLFITPAGDPMTVRAYEKVHAAAVRRIGLVPAKSLGTTPHGHRHAYGQYLRRLGIDKKVRQVAMHHKSIISQEIYTEADLREVVAAMRAASNTLDISPKAALTLQEIGP